jgi:glycosyltransferase involved in cell wall biosynthesis
MALVSILIPTYNQAEYVSEAIESALEQDWPEVEVVVSDDASRDETQTVLNRYRAESRVRLYRNDANLGRVGNYRRCLYQLARGTWALLLDGDDYLVDSSYISRAMRRANEDDTIDLFFGNSLRLREDIGGAFRLPDENVDLPELLDGKDLFLRLASEKVSLFHRTCLYKVAKARDLDFYRADIISSDWESLFRYILTGRVGFFSDCVAVWRIHGENATRNMSVDDRIGNLQRIVGPYNYAKTDGVFPKRVIEWWFDRMLLKQADVDIRDLIRSGDSLGRRRFLSALREANPRVYRRIRIRPRVLWTRLKFGAKGLRG